MKVTFLGAGLFGEALGRLAEVNEHEIKFYDPFRFPDIKIEDAISEAEVIVYVAPAEAYKEILPKLPKDKPLILASKGFVSLKPFAGFENFSALGGAAFAEDIMEAKNQLRLTASSEISEQLFTTELVTVEYTEDTKGIVLLGALKNVYALGAGMFIEDENPEQYFSEAYFEMQDILKANGADPETAALSCGVADLLLSSTPSGRNFCFGREIAEHPESKVEPAGTVEGLTVIKSFEKFPDFVIPEDTELFWKIVNEVKRAAE